MPGPNAEGGAVVIYLARHRRRRSTRRDVWLVALAAGALVAFLLALARPFDARAGTGSEPLPSVLAD